MATGLGLDFKRVNAKSFDVDFQLTSVQRTTYLTDPVRLAGQFCADPDTGEMFVLNSSLDVWLPVGGNITEHSSDLIYSAGKPVSVTTGDTFVLYIAKVDVPSGISISDTDYWKSGGGSGTPGADGRGYANTVTPGVAESLEGTTFTFTLGYIGISAYVVGTYVLLSGSVNPTLNYIIGTITDITGSIITVSSDVVANDAGNGTTDDSDWTISVTGRKGTNGSNGTVGANAYTYIAYASSDTGTGFSNTFNAALDYVAIKSTTSPLSPPIASDFTGLWKNYKGADGPTGATGSAGAAGSAGTNGANADMTRTSTTSNSIGTGTKTFAYSPSTNLGWTVGTRLRVASNATPTAWMSGIITAVSTTSVTITSDAIGANSGTSYTDWNLSIAGQPGSAGSAFQILTNPTSGSTFTITPVSSTELAPNYYCTFTSSTPAALQIVIASLPNGASGILRILNNDSTVVKVLTIPAGDKLLNGSTVSQSTISCQPAGRYTEIAFKKDATLTLWYYVD